MVTLGGPLVSIPTGANDPGGWRAVIVSSRLGGVSQVAGVSASGGGGGAAFRVNWPPDPPAAKVKQLPAVVLTLCGAADPWCPPVALKDRPDRSIPGEL